MTGLRWLTLTFLQRVSIACYAERCISYDRLNRFCLTDRPTVSLEVIQGHTSEHLFSTTRAVARGVLEGAEHPLIHLAEPVLKRELSTPC